MIQRRGDGNEAGLLDRKHPSRLDWFVDWARPPLAMDFLALMKVTAPLVLGLLLPLGNRLVQSAPGSPGTAWTVVFVDLVAALCGCRALEGLRFLLALLAPRLGRFLHLGVGLDLRQRLTKGCLVLLL